MSQTDSPSWDDFEEAEIDDSNNGSDWIDLEPGDEVGGTITDVNLQAGHNGVIEIDGQPMYLNQKMRRQMIASLVKGCQIVARCEDKEESFEDDNGEQVTYNPKRARFGRPEVDA